MSQLEVIELRLEEAEFDLFLAVDAGPEETLVLQDIRDMYQDWRDSLETQQLVAD